MDTGFVTSRLFKVARPGEFNKLLHGPYPSPISHPFADYKYNVLDYSLDFLVGYVITDDVDIDWHFAFNRKDALLALEHQEWAFPEDMQLRIIAAMTGHMESEFKPVYMLTPSDVRGGVVSMECKLAVRDSLVKHASSESFFENAFEFLKELLEAIRTVAVITKPLLIKIIDFVKLHVRDFGDDTEFKFRIAVKKRRVRIEIFAATTMQNFFSIRGSLALVLPKGNTGDEDDIYVSEDDAQADFPTRAKKIRRMVLDSDITTPERRILHGSRHRSHMRYTRLPTSSYKAFDLEQYNADDRNVFYLKTTPTFNSTHTVTERAHPFRQRNVYAYSRRYSMEEIMASLVGIRYE